MENPSPHPMEPLSPAAVAATLAAIRARAPLIHNVTGVVVANSTANALLAIGASPAMLESEDEVEAFVATASSLVVNLGSMTTARARSCRLAARAAQMAGRPWVLDPVAVGAVPARLALARDLLAYAPSAVRGNASEIAALAGLGGGGRGVDADGAAQPGALAAAMALARSSGAAVAVTGAVDHVTDGARVANCRNGHAMMTRVTGLGCTASAIVGACLAVEPDAWIACAHALALVGVAGENAAARARGPGSLQMEFLDALYRLDAFTLEACVMLEPGTARGAE